MKKHLIGIALLCAILGPRLAHATPSACDAVTGNLVVNCGFEAANGQTAAYPAGWTTDAGYALHADVYNQVIYYDLHSGLNAIKFGNSDAEGPAGISQTLTTVAGATYDVTFWTYIGITTDPNAFFHAAIDGTTEVSLVGNDPTAGAYAQYGYRFVGTGSDVVSFMAQTDPSEWYLDDVVVMQSAAAPGGGGVAAVPEPGSFTLLGGGIVGLAAARRSLRRR